MCQKITLRGIINKAEKLWKKTNYSNLDAREAIFKLLIRELKQLERRIKQNIIALEDYRDLKVIAIDYAQSLEKEILGKEKDDGQRKNN